MFFALFVHAEQVAFRAGPKAVVLQARRVVRHERVEHVFASMASGGDEDDDDRVRGARSISVVKFTQDKLVHLLFSMNPFGFAQV